MEPLWQNEGVLELEQIPFHRCIDCTKGSGVIDGLRPVVDGWIKRDNGAASIFGLLDILWAANGRKVKITVELV